MTKCFPILAILAIATTVLPAEPSSVSQAPVASAWLILQQSFTSKRVAKRANVVRALRLLPGDPKAQKMAESALTDPSPKVRAAAARALGPMRAVSSVPNLKAALNDKDPAVVLAAAHSLLLLGHPEEAYEFDYEVLIGERKGADGFVASQLGELKDPKAVAMMVVETGIGFVPFGGAGYELFKRVSKDHDSPVRVAAAKELAKDRDPKIDAALAKACSDKKWSVRAAAVFAIAKRDNRALLNMIIPLLEDKNDIVRYETSAAVLRLSDGKAAEQALNSQSSIPSRRARRRCIDA
jgi:HEAT repeat protein